MKLYDLTTPQKNIWNLQKTFPYNSISNLCGAVFWGRQIKKNHRKKHLFIELQSGMRLQFTEEKTGAVQYTAEYKYTDIVNYIEKNAKK